MAYLDNPVESPPPGDNPRAARKAAEAAFRLAMRELASGVALVTTGRDDARAGCTATAVCSLSLEPPSLIVSISRASATLARVRANGAFGVNILAGGHEHLADRFSGRSGVRGAARFEGARWIALATGSPLLEDALAAFDCAVEEIIERHTHAIVIGAVKAIRRHAGAACLLHWRGGYERPDTTHAAPVSRSSLHGDAPR